MMESEILADLVWAAPFVGAAIVTFLSLFKGGKARGYIAVILLFVSAVSATLLVKMVLDNNAGFVQFSYPWITSLNVDVEIYVDTLSAFMALIVTWLCALIGFYSLKYMEGDSGWTRYWFFFSFFTGSMLLIVMSGNLLLTFVGWEGTGLASYALIGYWFMDEREKWVGDPDRKALGVSMEFAPSHSSVRALMFTRLGDVGLIAGIAVLYFVTNPHTLSISAIAQDSVVRQWGGELAVRGMLLPFLLVFSLGALAKSAQFPFHEWLVTAMTGPTSVSALIHAATMVKAGVFFMLRFTPIFYLLLRLLPAAAGDVSLYFTIITFIGAFTAFFMATQGIVAKELKLVLAFSTASQLGYMFMAAGASGLIGDFVNGFIATFSMLMSHAIFKASLFLAAGAVIHTVESRYMDEMGGLSKIMKVTFVAMLVAALSLSGLPPLMGFWTKDSVLEVVFQSGLLIPFLLAVVTASFTAFYSLRMVMKTFVVSPSARVVHMEEKHELHEAHAVMLGPYSLLAFATVAIGVLWLFVGSGFFTALAKHVLAIDEVPSAFSVKLNPSLTALSIVMVSIGLGAAYLMYGKPQFDRKVAGRMETSASLRGVRNFLFDRWYVNSVYYIVFVSGGRWLSNGLFKWLDTKVIDGFYHRFVPWFTTRLYVDGFKFFETGIIDRVYHSGVVTVFTKAVYGTFRYFETAVIDHVYHVYLVKAALSVSNGFRKVQTGRINHYILAFVLGFIVLVVMFLLGVL